MNQRQFGTDRSSKLGKLSLTLLLVALCQVAAADCIPTGCIAQVEQIYIEADGGLWIQTTGNELLANCTPDSGIYLRLPGDTAKFKEVYAALLSAYLTDKVVNIRIQPGTNPCRILYVSMMRQ